MNEKCIMPLTNEELTAKFESKLSRLDESEIRKFLEAEHFGVCADCGKPIFVSGGRRKRCDECQGKRNRAKQKEFMKKMYKSTHYSQYIKCGRKAGKKK